MHKFPRVLLSLIFSITIFQVTNPPPSVDHKLWWYFGTPSEADSSGSGKTGSMSWRGAWGGLKDGVRAVQTWWASNVSQDIPDPVTDRVSDVTSDGDASASAMPLQRAHRTRGSWEDGPSLKASRERFASAQATRSKISHPEASRSAKSSCHQVSVTRKNNDVVAPQSRSNKKQATAQQAGVPLGRARSAPNRQGNPPHFSN